MNNIQFDLSWMDHFGHFPPYSRYFLNNSDNLHETFNFQWTVNIASGHRGPNVTLVVVGGWKDIAVNVTVPRHNSGVVRVMDRLLKKWSASWKTAQVRRLGLWMDSTLENGFQAYIFSL